MDRNQQHSVVFGQAYPTNDAERQTGLSSKHGQRTRSHRYLRYGTARDGSPFSGCNSCNLHLQSPTYNYYQALLDLRRHQAKVVSSNALQVYELEDQLSRAVRDRLDCTAFVKDEGRRKTFSAALKPECPLCQTEAKGAILEPCRHLAACCSCANSLTR